MTTVSDIDLALKCGKPGCPCARGRNRHCPVLAAHSHGDSEPSLTVKVAGDRIAFNCKRGCDQQAVIDALTERNLWPPEQDANPRNDASNRAPNRRKPSHFIREWAYGDPPLAYHGRFDYDDGEGKEFLWRLPEQQWGQRGIGLGELSISELPLYNVDLLTEEPDETVYVCEGEKAADACIEHGLIAVALGGGASQTKFGDCLEPLRRRDVVLWPDNDAAGAQLMAVIASVLPKAKFLTPPNMPEKGDAFDFFAASRSVDELREMTKSPEPIVRVDADGMTVEIPDPGGHWTFRFEEVNSTGPNVIDANLLLTPSITGLEGADAFSQRLNVRSASAKNSLRLALEGMYGKGHTWVRIINAACTRVEAAYSNQVTAIALSEIPLNEAQRYRVEGMVPEGQMTILFGLGGAGKTETSLSITAAVLLGRPWLGHATLKAENALFVDYEADGDTVRRRFQRILEGLGAGSEALDRLHYFGAKGVPLPMLTQRIKREAARVGAEFIVIDSAAAACGGEPERAESALNTFNAIKAIGLTAILIAHVRKPEPGARDSGQWKMQPFGSGFWHNSARATFYVDGATSEHDEDHINLALWCRKMNDGRRPRAPITARITFDGDAGPVTVRADDLATELMDDRQTNAEVLERMLDDCAPEWQSPQTLSERSGDVYDHFMTDTVIRVVMAKNPRRFVERKEGRTAVWQRKSRADESEAPPPWFAQ